MDRERTRENGLEWMAPVVSLVLRMCLLKRFVVLLESTASSRTLQRASKLMLDFTRLCLPPTSLWLRRWVHTPTLSEVLPAPCAQWDFLAVLLPPRLACPVRVIPLRTRMAQSCAKLVYGPRSSVPTPTAVLGLIVNKVFNPAKPRRALAPHAPLATSAAATTALRCACLAWAIPMLLGRE